MCFRRGWSIGRDRGNLWGNLWGFHSWGFDRDQGVVVTGKQAQVDVPRCNAVQRWYRMHFLWCVNYDLDFQIAR